MPKRPCLHAGCGSFAEYRGYCKVHAAKRERTRNRAGADLYWTKRWRMTSRKKLSTDPICEECGKRLATQVDHVIPLDQGGDKWAMGNLASLCSQCHGSKTRKEQLAR